VSRAPRAGVAVFVATLCAAGAHPATADTFYAGERDEGRLFTNIPQGEGLKPLPGFGDDGAEAPSRPPSRARLFDDLIESTARQFRVNPDLVRALIQVESGFDPAAVSRKGARGLMQLMPDTARQYQVHNLFDPLENIRAGVRHLSHLVDVYGEDLDRVLAAYNAGEEAVRRANGIPDFDETRIYVRKIKRLYSGTMRLRQDSQPSRPAFFTYEDDSGVLHASDRPIAPAALLEPCADC
jgi:hypothetical protein